MTQAEVRTVRKAETLAAPVVATVPHPREPLPHDPRDAERALPALVVTTPVAIENLVRPRARRSWPVAATDGALALVVAASLGPVTTLPTVVVIATALLWPLLLVVAGHYRRQALGNSRGKRVWVAGWTGVRTSVLVLALSPWVTIVDPLALAQLSAAFAVASVGHALLARPGNRPRLVLAGRPRDVREAMLELEVGDRHDVVAACLTRPSKVPLGDLATYVGLGAASEVAERHGADAVVVLPGARLPAAEVRRLHWALAAVDAELCVGTGLIDVTPGRARVVASGGLNLVHVVPASLRGPRRWVKEALERGLATLGMVVLLPVMAAVGILVRLDSEGPAVYRQERVGRDGRLFTMYKFRSMSTAADAERTHLVAYNEADGVLFKIRHDPRVTRAGRWLRRTSLDELPQLWNVVRGEMSLVGPRPALPGEVARYGVDPRRRLVVKPGMTGLWQVSGRSDLELGGVRAARRPVRRQLVARAGCAHPRQDGQGRPGTQRGVLNLRDRRARPAQRLSATRRRRGPQAGRQH